MNRWLHLGIVPIPPGMRPSSPSDFSLQALTQNTNVYAEKSTTIVTAGTNVALTVTQVLAKNIVLKPGASGPFTITLPSTSTILDALGPTMPLDGSFFFELSIFNSGTGQPGTLTPSDSSTSLSPSDNALPDQTTCKWMVQVNPVVSSAFGRPTTLSLVKTSTAIAVGSAGSGTVLSVAQTVPVEFTISGSPVTTTGTLAIGKAVENANTVWAGPTTGGPAEPTFRPLVAADIPVVGGSVTSITATNPIVVTPDPITSTGTVSHNTSGVTPGTYGDSTHVGQFTVDAKGHITAATNVATPSFTAAAWVTVTMVAGGGGGATATAAGTPGPGGGGGETCQGFQLKTTPGGNVAYVIGAGGTTDTDGGDTTFGGFAVRGGKKGVSGGNSGAGGGANGAAGVAAAAAGLVGTAESAGWFGGSSGGGRGSGTAGNGATGGGSGGQPIGGAGGVAGGGNGGGGGGAATPYGPGGNGGNGGAVGGTATSTNYGAGGGGGGGPNNAGGSGIGGYLLITYLTNSTEFTSGSGNFAVPS